MRITGKCVHVLIIGALEEFNTLAQYVCPAAIFVRRVFPCCQSHLLRSLGFLSLDLFTLQRGAGFFQQLIFTEAKLQTHCLARLFQHRRVYAKDVSAPLVVLENFFRLILRLLLVKCDSKLPHHTKPSYRHEINRLVNCAFLMPIDIE